MDFRLPNLGEGIDSATVVTVKVKPGDAVTAGQDLLEVETDKANMPVAAEAAGTVESVSVKPGDKINVGAVLLKFAGKNGSAPLAPRVGSQNAPRAGADNTPPAPRVESPFPPLPASARCLSPCQNKAGPA